MVIFKKNLTDAWRTLKLTGAAPVTSLRNAYADPARLYHNLDQIEACLELAEEFDHHDSRITLAICYHDIVYDTHADDNEELSAKRARRDFENAGASPSDCEAVCRLILATTHRAKPSQEDEKILVDLDLSILGAPAKSYDRYVRSIRQEYGWVAEKNFRAGRAKLLRGMLARDVIYSTPRMVVRYEEPARENLQRELNAIGKAESKTT